MGKITAANGNVMRWARLSSNTSLLQAAKRLGKAEEDILAWEDGADHPTYVQLETLGTLYQVPLAIFFFPDIPELSNSKASFRSLPEHIYDTLASSVIKIMNDARVIQMNLHELNGGINPSPMLLTNVDYSSTIGDAASELRELLSVSIDEQKRIRNADEALKIWRDRFWECGIYVFKEAFSDNSISGFCLYDEIFPVIYINNSMSFTRQIFTLFHEFYHLISNTNGIDKTTDDFFDQLTIEQLRIEQACNQFAAEFLVPHDDFSNEIEGVNIDDVFIAELARKYSVSREVISRRLFDRGIISEADYASKRQDYFADVLRAKERKKDGPQGNYYNTKVAYLGDGYLGLVFGSYNKQKIDVFQLSEYTRTKIEHLPKLEASWGWRGMR